MTDEDNARFFHEEWVAGVLRHYPGTPKASYVVPWDDAPDWEREGAAAVYQQVKDFIEISAGHAARLTRDQKSQFVAICWIGQMYKQFGEPKPSHVADWSELSKWHQETDADIFERIEERVKARSLRTMPI